MTLRTTQPQGPAGPATISSTPFNTTSVTPRPVNSLNSSIMPSATPTLATETPESMADKRAERFSTGPQDNRYMELREGREALRLGYIKAGRMADPTRSYALSEAIEFKGDCEDMCPEFERHEREYQKALSEFEKIEGTDFVDHAKAVKRYRRSAAGDPEPMPCDVRPPRVLVQTLNYLFHTLIPTKTLEACQPFVRDRSRAIRNDFTLQNYRGMEAIECHERIARFHIVCAFKFCSHPKISLQQEQEQMRKTLQSLREYYADMNEKGIVCPNEPEFQAYYILSHLWQNDIVTTMELLPPQVFDHALVQLAIKLQQMVQCSLDETRSRRKSAGGLNFYSKFFRMLGSPEVPYLFACLLHQEFFSIRRSALRAMNSGFYNLSPHIPVSDIVDMLGYNDEDEALGQLEYHGIKCEVNDDGVVIAHLGKQKQAGGVKRQPFLEDQAQSLTPSVSVRLIESKVDEGELVDIIDGKSSGKLKEMGGFQHSMPAPRAPAIPSAIPSRPAMSFAPETPAATRKDAAGFSFVNQNRTAQQNQTRLQSTSNAPTPMFRSPFTAVSKSQNPIPDEPSFISFATPESVRTDIGLNSAPPSAISGDLRQRLGPPPSTAPSNTFSPLQPAFTSTPAAPSQIHPPLQQQTPLFSFTAASQKPAPSQPISQPAFSFSSSQPQASQQIAFPPTISVSTTPGPVLLNDLRSANNDAKIPPILTNMQKSSSTQAPSPQSLQKPASLAKPPKPASPVKRQPPTVEEVQTFDLLVSYELSSIAEEELSRDLDYRDLMDIIITETVEEFSDELATQVADSLEDMYEQAEVADTIRSLNKTFAFWFKAAKKSAERKAEEFEKRQERAVRFYLNVLGSANGPSLVRKRGTGWMGSQVNKWGGGWGIEVAGGSEAGMDSILAQAEEEADRRQAEYFRHLDITSIVFDSLLEVNKAAGSLARKSGITPVMYWKVLVCTAPFATTPNGTDPRASGKANRFASIWTRSKFGTGGDGSDLTALDTGDQSYLKFQELLRVSVDMWEGGSRGRSQGKRKVKFCLFANHVDVCGDAQYPMKPNSSALASGTSAILFQCSIYDDTAVDKSSWWEAERDRLYALLSALPVSSGVPLLISYWQTDLLPYTEFSEGCVHWLNLPSVLNDNGGPISAVDLLLLNDNLDGEFNGRKAAKSLEEGLKWLASSSKAQPVLRNDVIQDVVEKHTADAVRFAFTKFEESVPEGDFSLDPHFNISTFNCLIEVFNAQLDIIEKVLTDDLATDLAWPAIEYTGTSDPYVPPINWNSDATRSMISKVIQAHKLPHMPLPSSDDTLDAAAGRSANIRLIRSVYESYVTQLTSTLKSSSETLMKPSVPTRLSQLSGRDTASSSLMSSVWSKLGPWERSCAYRERDARFPFARVAMCFARWTVEKLDVFVDEWKKQRVGWYNVNQVDVEVKSLVGLVNVKLAEWESNVMGEYWNNQSGAEDEEPSFDEACNDVLVTGIRQEEDPRGNSSREIPLSTPRIPKEVSFHNVLSGELPGTPSLSRSRPATLLDSNYLFDDMAPPPVSPFASSTVESFTTAAASNLSPQPKSVKYRSTLSPHPTNGSFSTSLGSSRRESSSNSPLKPGRSETGSAVSSSHLVRPESEVQRLKRRLSEVMATSKKELETSKRRIADESRGD
ncbi:hypothetical protein HDV05_006702 [Chytridiales sp. JEL 0842]|nr:hypothetical protein HDV05_006702 [Chytridiales sp. JEL 0842]